MHHPPATKPPCLSQLRLAHVEGATRQGLLAGLAGGLINTCLVASLMPHLFDTTRQLVVWGLQLTAWYIIGAGLATAVSGMAISMVGWHLHSGKPVAHAQFYRYGAATSIAGFWSGMALNFWLLPQPVQPDALHLAANGLLLVLLGTVWFASTRSLAPPCSRRLRLGPWLAAALIGALVITQSSPGSISRNDPTAHLLNTNVSTPVSGRIARSANLLLITVDTLRADHLGFYGYPRDTSPFLDSLAAEGTILDLAFATKPLTSSSFASIFTGTYPRRHGVHNTSEVLGDNNLTLAEILHAAGYSTYAVVTNPNLYPIYKFDQGFDSFLFGAGTAEEQTNTALRRFAMGMNEPFFLWVHYIDPHSPYSPPPPYSRRYLGDAWYHSTPLPSKRPKTLVDSGLNKGPRKAEQNLNLDWYIAQYDGEIRYTDDQIRSLMAGFGVDGLLDRTLVVFTSDHGESFGEQGYFGHGMTPHDSGSRVPLFFRLRGVVAAGRRVSTIVSTLDILPTVLDILGLRIPTDIQGQNLAGRLTSDSALPPGQPFAIIEAGFGRHVGRGNQQALRTGNWKYVWRDTRWIQHLRRPTDIFWMWNAMLEGGLGSDELYDLRADPGECDNIVSNEPQRAALMKRQLLAALALQGPPAPEAQRISREEVGRVSPEAEEQLRALGYID